jgi:hypothetical protein
VTHSYLAYVKQSIVIALCLAAVVRAEEQKPVRLTLHPMAAPTPALKYRLLPKVTDMTSGNAAVPYGKVTAEEGHFFSDRALWDKIDDVWREMPLDQLRKEEIRIPDGPIFFLEQGARCKYCDWQLPIGEMPFYLIRLPEAQQSRRYSRMLAVKARREIADQKFEAAIKTFGTNYALARNVAKGESLVHGLIGIAMCGIMFPQVTEYIEQPDAPNLYWALSTLPTTMINMNDALGVESNALELSFPELRDVETARRTPDEWRAISYRFAVELARNFTTAERPWPKPSFEELDTKCEELAPIAKASLTKAGLTLEEVDAMSVHQLALAYFVRSCHRMFDDAAKYYMLPYPEAIEGVEASVKLINDPTDETRPLTPVVGPAMDALKATRTAIVRTDRQIAVLRMLEALRIYAAAHEGQLPQSLADLTEVPIPEDPVTCKPFVYRLVDSKAILEGPALPNAPLHYEITMAPVK